MEVEDGEDERIRNENTQLLIEIAHLCRKKHRKNPENIFLLGLIGAGKSALVNTLIKVIAGKYIPKAKPGEGRTQSKTLNLERYKSCGVTRDDIIDGTQRDIVQGMLHRLPTILDSAGRGDINTESLREILELIIGGYIPPGTSIEALEKKQKTYGIGALKDLCYPESNSNWKVTKVVFVQSCRDTVAENLIKCLQSVLTITDPDTDQPLYTGDIFVVITKYDLVKDNLDDGLDTITTSEFEAVEDKVVKIFSIQGAKDDNMIRWVSYTDAVNKDNPYIDNIALKFIKRMVMPVNQPDVEHVKPVRTYTTKMKLGFRKWWNTSIRFLFFCFLIALLAWILFKLITKPPNRY